VTVPDRQPPGRVARVWHTADPPSLVTHCVNNALRYQRFWMNLQTRYDLEIEKDRLGTVLDEIHPLSAAS